MNVAIISINDRIALHENTAKSIDSVWFKKYLEFTRPGIKVSYITNKILETKKCDDVIHYEDADLNEFDELYIQNSMTHFTGRDIKPHTVDLIKKIAKYKKLINVLFTDPSMFFMNFPEKIFHGKNMKYKDELRIEEKEIDAWKGLDLKALWTGSDYSKYIENIGKRYYQHIDDSENVELFEFCFINKELPSRSNLEKGYDICYWGDKRQSDRQKKIKKFMHPVLKKLFIGQESDIQNSICYKKQKHKEMIDLIQGSRSALVIGDNAHDGNITTFRFFEAIRMGLVAFIDKNYDPEMKLIKDDVLRKVLYVENGRDIVEKLYFIKKNNAFREIIKLQDEELKKWEHLKI